MQFIYLSLIYCETSTRLITIFIKNILPKFPCMFQKVSENGGGHFLTFFPSLCAVVHCIKEICKNESYHWSSFMLGIIRVDSQGTLFKDFQYLRLLILKIPWDHCDKKKNLGVYCNFLHFNQNKYKIPTRIIFSNRIQEFEKPIDLELRKPLWIISKDSLKLKDPWNPKKKIVNPRHHYRYPVCDRSLQCSSILNEVLKIALDSMT